MGRNISAADTKGAKMANDFYEKLLELKGEIDASFPYKSVLELSGCADDFQKMDLVRMLIEVCTDTARGVLTYVGYRGPVLRDVEKREVLSNISVDCIHACAGTSLYNDIALVQRLLEQIGYIAYKSYSPKAYQALFDVESDSPEDKE